MASSNPVLDGHGVLRVKGRALSPPVPFTSSYENDDSPHLWRGRELMIAKVGKVFWIPQQEGSLLWSPPMHCLKEIEYQANESTIGISSDKSHDGLSPCFFLLRSKTFDPLHVELGRSKVRRLWCCLLTCLNTRAVHFEFVRSMGREDFVMFGGYWSEVWQRYQFLLVAKENLNKV